ncbi:MAG: 50S ribosomal protein L32 [Phycisphaerae bacterium]
MLPVARTSKSRKGMRRAHHALKGANFSKCPTCGEPKLPHRACSNCGHVNRRLSLVKAEKA